jgi:hypothetical protein
MEESKHQKKLGIKKGPGAFELIAVVSRSEKSNMEPKKRR